MLVFLKSSSTTGSPVLDVDVRGDNLGEVVAPAVGAPLFRRVETRVGVRAFFYLTNRPPVVASLHIKKWGKGAKKNQV